MDEKAQKLNPVIIDPDVQFEALLQKIQAGTHHMDLDRIRSAYEMAKEAHQGQKRKDGNQYITHCVETVRVSVSGSAEPVSVLIEQTGSNICKGTVAMPAPADIHTYSFSCNGENFSLPAVRFEGITHLLSFLPLDKETAETIVKEQCSALQADALGIMQIDLSSGTLLPLVYVPKSGTLFWEGSCASGTAAAGAFLRRECGPGKWEFTEPAGRLIIAVWQQP